jgi:hypothetical protein
MHIDAAPRDGRYVLAFFGTHIGAYVYFENGQWLAPENINDPNSPVSPVEPLSWLDIPTRTRGRA